MNDKFIWPDTYCIKPEDFCPFCLDELRRGIPEDGKCGHEKIRAKHPGDGQSPTIERKS